MTLDSVGAFGYASLRSDKIDDWAEYGPKFLGLQLVERTSSALKFRMDDRKQRIVVSSEETAQNAFGWEVEDTVVFAKALKELGVDVIDCSSGGLTGLSTALPVKRSLGFQVPFAAAVKRQAGIHTMAVGLILDGPQAEAILQAGDADLIAIGRQALFDPFWALHAAQELGCDADFEMWTPEYGWWLDKRKNNLVDIKK